MALAKFLGKAGLNASQILQNYDRKKFEDILLSHTIGIGISPNLKNRKEGLFCTDMLIRLLARLYPNITFLEFDKSSNKLVQKFVKLAAEINPEISVRKNVEYTIAIILGEGDFELKNVPTFYLGSDGWVSKFSKSKFQIFGNSNNPFGAGASACFGAANIFREVFKKQLPYSGTDEDFTFSVFDYTVNSKMLPNVPIGSIDIDETFLVGVGAIGNATVWALSKIDDFSGKLFLIDDEKLDLSNLQRYSLTSYKDVNRPKVDLAKEYFNENDSKDKVFPISDKWEIFCEKRNNWDIKRVAVAIDSGVGRIAIQSSLPKTIFNAWTQIENLGISRHYDFQNDVCLACLYLTEHEIPAFYQEVAKSLKIPEDVILNYLVNDKSVDMALLEQICKANQIPIEVVIPFINEPIEILYSNVICSGTLLELTGSATTNQNVEVPCAFESALAGILLASEIIIDAGKLRNTSIHPISSFNLLKPITKYILNPRSKHESNNCICQDDTYQSVYKAKYS